MSETARNETETSGEYGEQVVVHGKTSGGVYKPIYIGDDGKVKIDPVPPDVNAIADEVESRLYCSKDATPHVRTYPKLANAVVVLTGLGIWTEGLWTEIVPANTITEPFWLLAVCWQVSAYESILEIGTGASGSEVEIANISSKILYLTAVGFASARPISLNTKIKVAANTRISVRCADASIAINTHYVKLSYLTGL